MDKIQAFSILQIPEGASPQEIKEAFERCYGQTKQLQDHAPLESQKQLYRKKMSLYWQAYAALVDINNPENVSKFSEEKTYIATAAQHNLKERPSQFFESESIPEEKKEKINIPWKSIALVALTVFGLLFAWKFLFTVPEPVRQLMQEMEYISGGTFMMGCTQEQKGNCLNNELPEHPVSLTSYKIGKYEVTRKQWFAVMKYYPPYDSPCNEPDCPIVHVSWDEVQDFLQKINKMTGQSYRLPTEAEWEYAARGGNSSKKSLFAGSNKTNEITRTGLRPFQIGKFNPNEKLLYDMSGNVWEWCQDGFDEKYYGKSPKLNPLGPNFTTCKVIRGGSFKSKENSMRVSSRNCLDRSQHADEVGFRLALTFIR